MALVPATLAIALFIAAAWTDIRSRRIPNGVSVALALVGLARIGMALVAGESALTAALDLAAALTVFVLAAVAFRFRLHGGGDVKLLAAGALWLGAAALGPYILFTAVAGGVMAMLFVAWHFVLPASMRGARPSLPYAVAIAAGGIFVTATIWT